MSDNRIIRLIEYRTKNLFPSFEINDPPVWIPRLITEFSVKWVSQSGFDTMNIDGASVPSVIRALETVRKTASSTIPNSMGWLSNMNRSFASEKLTWNLCEKYVLCSKYLHENYPSRPSQARIQRGVFVLLEFDIWLVVPGADPEDPNPLLSADDDLY